MDRDWLSSALLAWQVWLTEQEEHLDPEAWDALRAEADGLRQRIVTAVQRGRPREAETALTAFAEQHRIRAILSMTRPHDAGVDDLLRGGTRGPDTRQLGFESSRGADTRALGGILDSIGRLLGRRHERPPIVTFPEVRVPAEVPERTTFTVQVAARSAPTPHTGDPLRLPRMTSGRVDLEVAIELPDDGLEARTPLEQPLRVHEDGTSAAILFELFARAPGAPRVEVVFRYDKVEQTRLSRRVHVLPEAVPVSATAAAGVATSGGPVSAGGAFRGLVLRVDVRHTTEEHRLIRVTLDGPGWGGVPHEHHTELPRDAWCTIADLSRDLPQTRLLGPGPAETRLQNVGAKLAATLLGPAIARELARRDEGTALHVESDDAWVPWELLFLEPGGGGHFLGERFAVTRWLRVGHAQEALALERAVLVAPPASGLSSATEREALRAFLGRAPEERATLGEVQARLRAGQRTVVHFVCHGASRPDAVFPEELVLEDDETLHTADVRSAPPGEPGDLAGALVFANACEVGIATPSLWAFGGWAEACLRAGAAAFVAPSWAVGDRTAALLAETFYRHARDGMPLGEAARLARVAARRPGSVYRLGYAVYAAPNARVVRPAAPAAKGAP